MDEIMGFQSRESFRNWLCEHCLSSAGIWLLFGKKGGPQTIKASEALEEALCFGWIDGKMQRIDDLTYRKYFAQRRKNSKWSEVNKALVYELERKGRMTDYGRKKVEEAKANGQWSAQIPHEDIEAKLVSLEALLKTYESAYINFASMSLSVKKTYTRAYFDAKTDVGRIKRLQWMVERLNKNLKPM